MKCLNICKYGLASVSMGTEVPPMHGLLFQVGKEAFPPPVVAGFADPRKALEKILLGK